MGDSALILGQRLGAWCGHGPILEEDIALANVALDLLGQARLWLSLYGEREAGEREARAGAAARSEDELAFLRQPGEYRNLLLVEQANGHFGDTMARQYYFDAWHTLALEMLAASNDSAVSAIAAKAGREAAYHLRRSHDWIVRLGDGTEKSHERTQRSLDDLWTYTGEMFEGGFEALHDRWIQRVTETFAEATLQVPQATFMQTGSRQGRHTETLGYLLAEMQALPRAFPGAKW